MVVEVLTGARAVAVICLIVGIVTLLAGVGVGIYLSVKKAHHDSVAKVADAKQKIEQAQQRTAEAKQEIEGIKARGLEAGGVPDTSKASDAAQTAVESTQAAKTALEQIEGAIASLPEHLRFAGLLVMVGTVLIGVATVQFGGTSLF